MQLMQLPYSIIMHLSIKSILLVFFASACVFGKQSLANAADAAVGKGLEKRQFQILVRWAFLIIKSKLYADIMNGNKYFCCWPGYARNGWHDVDPRFKSLNAWENVACKPTSRGFSDPRCHSCVLADGHGWQENKLPRRQGTRFGWYYTKNWDPSFELVPKTCSDNPNPWNPNKLGADF